MEKDSRTLRVMAQQALSEIGSVLAQVPADTGDLMCAEILKAHRIACYGVGREGLMMRALCMRLMHLGLDAHAVGDVTAPPLGKGDLLIASAGPGSFSTVIALLGVARGAGARTMVVTAQAKRTRTPKCRRGHRVASADHGERSRRICKPSTDGQLI